MLLPYGVRPERVRYLLSRAYFYLDACFNNRVEYNDGVDISHVYLDMGTYHRRNSNHTVHVCVGGLYYLCESGFFMDEEYIECLLQEARVLNTLRKGGGNLSDWGLKHPPHTFWGREGMLSFLKAALLINDMGVPALSPPFMIYKGTGIK